MNRAPRLGTRLTSWWWDYLLIVGWLILVFLVVGLPQLIGWWDLSAIWTDPISADVAITLLTVVPYFLYLVLTEWNSPHATWGKRRTRIMVSTRVGGAPGGGRVVTRELVKVLPWQLGHMGTTRLVTSNDPTTAAIVMQIASLTLLVLVVGPILFGRRGLHDVLASTKVVSTQESS